jgi:hypothetical protein
VVKEKHDELQALYKKHPKLKESPPCVGKGWYPLLDELMSKIEFILPECKGMSIQQIKEKFGGLRFYVSFDNSVTSVQYHLIDDMIEQAERASVMICERCGAPGRPRGQGWVVTLCNKCESMTHNRRDIDGN